MKAICFLGCALMGTVCFADEEQQLAEALVFHASFDASAEAEHAKGDPKLYTAQTLRREKVQPGLHAAGVVLEERTGRYGGALAFRQKSENVVFYKGGGNLPYAKSRLQGTISLWMQLSPDQDLPAGYVDPLQITDKTWNDASLFLDFTKETPRRFRLGVFSDYQFWNPSDRKWEEIPDDQRPMVSVDKPGFSRDKWTHVAITYRGFNSSTAEGDAVLYLDGRPQGHVRGKQRYTWDPEQVVIMLGIYYIGRIDDLAIFDRPLSSSELQRLMELPHGVKSLR